MAPIFLFHSGNKFHLSQFFFAISSFAIREKNHFWAEQGNHYLSFVCSRFQFKADFSKPYVTWREKLYLLIPVKLARASKMREQFLENVFLIYFILIWQKYIYEVPLFSKLAKSVKFCKCNFVSINPLRPDPWTTCSRVYRVNWFWAYAGQPHNHGNALRINQSY